MRRFAMCLLGMALLGAGAVRAQEIDLAGTWQGTIRADKDARVVLKISKSAAGGLQGVVYAIDSRRPSEGMATSSMSLKGSDLAFAVESADGSYEGKLSGDGSQMAGTWMQGKEPRPLNLARANEETAWAIPAPEKVMPADADPALEVATIKPTPPDLRRDNFAIRGRHFIVENHTVADMVVAAYGLQAQQVQGGPDWFRSDKYDMDGTPDVPGQPSLKQMQAMLKKLLADRFGLTFHWDKKEMGVYAITVPKAGHKMTKSLGDPNGLPNQNGSGDANGRVDKYSNVTMGQLALILQFFLDRPVVDESGLQGRYDFVLKWTPNDRTVTDAATAYPGIFTAMEEEVGLKLEAKRAPTQVLVVDKVERPSEN
jgi:uncharacterized protein (TIGR03435 family)